MYGRPNLTKKMPYIHNVTILALALLFIWLLKQKINMRYILFPLITHTFQFEIYSIKHPHNYIKLHISYKKPEVQDASLKSNCFAA